MSQLDESRFQLPNRRNRLIHDRDREVDAQSPRAREPQEESPKAKRTKTETPEA